MTVRDVELPSLYRKSKAFVFASEYEGFGLPILEAFAAGCPAIISRANCFPRRDELRTRGSKRLTHFTWERTAELTRDGYMKIL